MLTASSEVKCLQQFTFNGLVRCSGLSCCHLAKPAGMMLHILRFQGLLGPGSKRSYLIGVTAMSTVTAAFSMSVCRPPVSETRSLPLQICLECQSTRKVANTATTTAFVRQRLDCKFVSATNWTACSAIECKPPACKFASQTAHCILDSWPGFALNTSPAMSI